MSKKKKQAKTKSAKFIYISECCNTQAHKPSVERSESDFKEGKYSECGLGKWRCGKCENRCKVKRQNVKDEPNGSDTGTTGN